MARPTDPARRAALLDAAIDYAAVHGLTDLSLRPLAEALGTQAPVLLHHFGSKERLVAEVLVGVQDRVRALGRAAEARRRRSGLPAVWSWVSDRTHEPMLVAFFEAYAVALRHPEQHAAFLDTVVQDWLDTPMAAVDDISATLAIAVVRGLALDRLTTHDYRRTDAAMRRFLTWLRADADSRGGR
jgi:AcrR family transcriptional regulator